MATSREATGSDASLLLGTCRASKPLHDQSLIPARAAQSQREGLRDVGHASGSFGREGISAITWLQIRKMRGQCRLGRPLPAAEACSEPRNAVSYSHSHSSYGIC